MRVRWSMLLALASAGVFLGFVVPVSANGPILRIAADFFNFDGTETSTAAPVIAPDGLILWVSVKMEPETSNVVIVPSAARTKPCPREPCNPGTGGAGEAPPGWINLQKHKNYALGLRGDGSGGSGDMHDNSIYYQWCVRRGPGPAKVEIKMASSGPDFETDDGVTSPTVFFEAAHVYIDASRIAGENRCTPAPPVGRTLTPAPGNRR